MNVSELARRLKTTPQKLLEVLPQHGYGIGRRAIKVDDRTAEKILRAWTRGEIKFIEEVRHERTLREMAAPDAPQGPVSIPPRIVVHEFARRLGVPVTALIRELMKNGVMASLNQEIDHETAAIIANDLGRAVEREEAGEDVAPSITARLEEVRERLKVSAGENRPPVVVVMGHVDHGKTKLLDAIRKTHVIETESGGITQHIGAYQTVVMHNNEKRNLTFLDTPGHEAFRAMRARGGKVADVAILVVAADDGVQPQTREAFQIIQNEKLPYIIALNKIDKKNADPEHTKSQLSEIGAIPEEWGGKAMVVPISAKVGQNIDQLLDMVLTIADLAELKADPKVAALGTVIESHLDPDQGVLATIVVQNGTLYAGDLLVGATTAGRARSLRAWNREQIKAASPGTPVQILGLKVVPEVGDVLEVTDNSRLVRERESELKDRETKKSKRFELDTAIHKSTVTPEDAIEAKKLKIILKSDVLGSEEAIMEGLATLQHSEVAVDLVSRGLGNVNDSDLATAEAGEALILAFRVLVPRAITEDAVTKGITIKTYDVIYGLLDEVKSRLEALLPLEIIRTDLGELEVLAIFRSEGNSTILGGRVRSGRLKVGASVEIMRQGEKIGEGKIGELQQNKIKVEEVDTNIECGLKLIGKTSVEVGDRLRTFTIEERRKKIGV